MFLRSLNIADIVTQPAGVSPLATDYADIKKTFEPSSHSKKFTMLGIGSTHAQMQTIYQPNLQPI